MQLLYCLYNIQYKPKEVETEVLCLYGLSQAEGSMSRTSKRISSKQSRIELWLFLVTEYSTLYDHVLNGTKSIEEHFSGITQSEGNRKAEGHLKKLVEGFNQYYSEAEIR